MSGVSSVMGNECSALVSVLTAVLHGVGVYSQHWNNVYSLDKHRHHGGRHFMISHEGLWRTCIRNGTSYRFDCVDLHNVPAWLLTVQVLVAVSFGGVLVSTMMKLLYHFNPSCNGRALIMGFVLLSVINGLLLLLAIGLYAPNYQSMYGKTKSVSVSEHPQLHPHHHHNPHDHDHYNYSLGWGYTVEVVSVILSIGSGLLALCEVMPRGRQYTEI